MRNLKLVFEERKPEDKEEDESCGHGDATDVDNETEEEDDYEEDDDSCAHGDATDIDDTTEEEL